MHFGVSIHNGTFPLFVESRHRKALPRSENTPQRPRPGTLSPLRHSNDVLFRIELMFDANRPWLQRTLRFRNLASNVTCDLRLGLASQ